MSKLEQAAKESDKFGFARLQKGKKEVHIRVGKFIKKIVPMSRKKELIALGTEAYSIQKDEDNLGFRVIINNEELFWSGYPMVSFLVKFKN